MSENDAKPRTPAFKIRDARFVLGAAHPNQFPNLDWPEAAVAGRSNVGKSSLLNMLLQRKKLVKVSRTPGRTRQINFFAVNEGFHLVDLPGYGYAKAPGSERKQWFELIRRYLSDRPQLKIIVLLLDIRREPSAEDLGALEFFRDAGVPCLVVLTKADKLALQQRRKQVSSVAKRLRLDPGDCLVASAEKGWGREEIWNSLLCFLSPESTDAAPAGALPPG
ncbi:MAG: YihA family ribosome biogenesis GTP-binding protein [Myxococcales bacterium]|nr:MAG: YihA family ribosome biogenesis GTP-binding protein [Myxococcales bacterium]